MVKSHEEVKKKIRTKGNCIGDLALCKEKFKRNDHMLRASTSNSRLRLVTTAQQNIEKNTAKTQSA